MNMFGGDYMSIKLTQMKCPNCGANLEFNGDRQQVFCTYCGTPIAITDENRTEVVTRTIDEAGVIKENRLLEEAKMYDDWEKRKEKRNLAIVIFAVIVIVMLVVIAELSGK